MKKLLILLLTLLLCVGILSAPALAASASLTGPGTVRAGDTITLTLKISGSGIYGVSGTLVYDQDQLTLTGTKQAISSKWSVEFSGNNFVAVDNNLTAPINKSTSLLTLTFKVKSLKTGTVVKVSFTELVTTDGNSDTKLSNASYSVKIAAPLSTDNTLKSLTIANAAISPAFSSKTTSYTAEVPYEVEKLEIKAVANSSKATVTVKNNTLAANATTKVSIIVKAEDGSTKTYTIAVKRAQDPNYVPSDNNDLGALKVEGFVLSPVFDSKITRYIVWLPYETESIKVSATAADKRASVEVIGGEDLQAGQDNEVRVVCTAENGEKKEYTIVARRAGPHEEPTEPTEPTQPTEPTEPTQPTQPTEPTQPSLPEPTEPGQEQKQPVSLWPIVIAALMGLAVGTGAGFLLGNRRRGAFGR